MKNIIIHGMRGTGKSTIGELLAKKLNLDFIDLDLFIEKFISEKLSFYINKNGWKNFRNIENKCLQEVLKTKNDKIISLGGGTIIFERNRKILLKNNSKLIYIYSDINEISKRIEKNEKKGENRNSLTGLGVIDELKKVYFDRKNIYENFYDLKINNNGKIENCIEEILNKKNYGLVCVPIIDFENDFKKINIINNSKEIKYTELRIDFLKNIEKLDEIISKIDKQIILTNRTNKEGGKFKGNGEQSIEILSKYINKVDFIDFELQNGTLINELKEKLKNKKYKKTKLILSHHNFKKTPTLKELKKVLKDMLKYNPDVYKITVMPKNKEDVKIINDLTSYFKENYNGKDFIFISMGNLGLETRIELPKKGCLLTFGSLGKISAPGQINYKELYNLIFTDK